MSASSAAPTPAPSHGGGASGSEAAAFGGGAAEAEPAAVCGDAAEGAAEAVAEVHLAAGSAEAAGLAEGFTADPAGMLATDDAVAAAAAAAAAAAWSGRGGRPARAAVEAGYR
mmetsp:Transcript_23892/g.72462  ORF Transcript_23892/g.72462 Transcript_23892/m.72462 type:complete len:113 (-) Transcript_23892:2-340(-)